MIYVRERDEDIYTPLHLMPPTLAGLSHAIGEKYNLDESKISAFYKQCTKGGVTVKIDDDMLRFVIFHLFEGVSIHEMKIDSRNKN